MMPSEWAANRLSEHIEETSCVLHFHPCSCHSEWRRSIFDPARVVERRQYRAGERRRQAAPSSHHEWFPPYLRLSDIFG